MIRPFNHYELQGTDMTCFESFCKKKEVIFCILNILNDFDKKKSTDKKTKND